MNKLLVTVLVILATIGPNPPAAAQQSAGSAGPAVAPGSSTSKPNPFPSSSAVGGPENKLNRNEAYSTAMQNCQSLPSSQRPACINETKKKFGEM